MADELHKFVGKCVAVVEGHIVASGQTRLEVYRKTKELHPHKHMTLRYIPKKEETLTFL